MRVGDKVLCIKNYQLTNSFLIDNNANVLLPKRGVVYTIRSMDVCPCTRDLVLRFVELYDGLRHPNSGKEYGYCATYFRKIDDTPELSTTTYEDIMEEIEERELQNA